MAETQWQNPSPETPVPSPQPQPPVKVELWKIKTEAETQDSLKKLKKAIEEDKMPLDLVKTYLDIYTETSEEMKPFLLWWILSGLNKRWVSIEQIKNEKITLKAWVQSLRSNLNIATHEETMAYQSLLNSYIQSWKISISGLNKALLYRTSSLDGYLIETDKKPWTTSEYAGRLMEKYALNFKKYGMEIDIKTWWITIKKENFADEQSFLNFKEYIKLSITDNQADKEFLLTFFDDIYYNEKKWIEENAIDGYQKSSTKIEAWFFHAINTLKEEQKYALGIKSEDEAKEVARKWKNNPIEAFKEAFNNGWWLLWVIFGIIWAFMWWKWWALMWFLAWMWIAGGWMSWAGEQIKNGLDKAEKKPQKPSSQGETAVEQPNRLFDKHNHLFENDENWWLDKPQLQAKWEALSKNENFKKSDASNLKIFDIEKNPEKLKTYFTSIWIKDISDEDKKYYEYIFKELYKDRKNIIWDSKMNPNEPMWAYLERESRTINTPAVVAGAGVAWVASWEGSQSEAEAINWEVISDQEKKEISAYFKLDKNTSEKLPKDLDSLWLNLFKLLKGYKNFIQIKLTWLDAGITNKIIESISRKVWLIDGKIEALKTKEMKDYWKLNNFKNNRWIINNQIKDLFEKTNSQVLPSAYVLVESNKINTPTPEEQKKIDQINAMFRAILTDDGEFDKTWTSFEILDANSNNWDIFDTKTDVSFFKKIWYNKDELSELSLLITADEKIESDATMWYMAWVWVLLGNDVATFATWIWAIPWAVIWWTYWAVDAFKDEDLMISLLKNSGAIPEEYRTDKKLLDNILAWVWVIPWVRLLTKWEKLAKYISKLSPERLAKFWEMKTKVAEMMKNSFNKAKDTTKITGIKPTNIENFTTRHINKSDIRKIRKSVNPNDVESHLQFLADDGTIWTIRNISWRSWKEILEIGPLWQPSLQRKATIDEFIEWVNTNIDKWKNINTINTSAKTLSTTESKIFQNIASKKISSIPVWKTETIWWIEIKNTWKSNLTWKFEFEYIELNWTKKRWSKDDIIKIIDLTKVWEEIKQIWKLSSLIKWANLSKTKIVDWHKVSFESWDVVVLTKDRTVLQWDELITYINKNTPNILKSFWVDLAKIPNPKIEYIQKLSDTFTKWVEKSHYTWKEIMNLKNLFSELTKPGRSFTQIIDTLLNSTNKTSDLSKILILWDKANSYAKLSSYKRLALNTWIASGVVYFEDNLWIDDVKEMIIYNLWWFIYWGIYDAMTPD